MDLLTNEDKDFIKNLSHEMKTQDNRGTAQPYALVIRTKTRQIRDFENCDNHAIYWEESEYEDISIFREAVSEYYGKDHDINKYLGEIGDISELRDMEYQISTKFDISISTFAYEDVMTADSSQGMYEGNFFLTEKACRLHMKQNHYHFREPDTYGIHLTRNPEMEKLYEIIHKLASELNGGKDEN